jgi:hypothetical protein
MLQIYQINVLIMLLSKILEIQNNGKSINTYICSIRLPKEIKTEIQFFNNFDKVRKFVHKTQPDKNKECFIQIGLFSPTVVWENYHCFPSDFVTWSC